jgi:filamentous hemagglutinin
MIRLANNSGCARPCPSAAKADAENGLVIAALKRCANPGLIIALAICGLISCQPSATNGASSALFSAGNAQADRPAGPVRDLSQDEAAGGHILRKHVGQTDKQLRERLEREPRITGASTYTDRPTAEKAVGAAIAASQDRIQRWLGRSGGHPNLVLDYDSASPVGRTMNRGESQSRTCAHALVVLKYSGPDQYYVLTSYPECR